MVLGYLDFPRVGKMRTHAQVDQLAASIHSGESVLWDFVLNQLNLQKEI